MRRLEPLRQRLHLDVERFVTILVAAGGIIGDEREAGDDAFEPDVRDGRIGQVIERDPPDARLGMPRKRRRVVERAGPQPFLRDPLAIDVRDDQIRLGREAA